MDRVKFEWMMPASANFYINDALEMFFNYYEADMSTQEINKLINQCATENMFCSDDMEIPEEIEQKAIKMLKERIGGIQISMFNEEGE